MNRPVGMSDGILKLAKLSKANSLDEIKAIFNFNMDQLMVFGSGVKGDPGDKGNPGLQGDQGYCVYGNGGSDSSYDAIRQAVEEEESVNSDENTEGADFFINQKGIFKVYRDGDRDVHTMLVWKEEDSANGTIPFIIKKAEEAKVAPQVTQHWNDIDYVNRITPNNSKPVVLVGDKSMADTGTLDPIADSPLMMYQDGSIAFVNSNGTTTYAYSINASYKERGSDFGRSGLWLGAHYDSTVNNSNDSSKLPHIFLDYLGRGENISNFAFIKGIVASEGIVTTAGKLTLAEYKDKTDAIASRAFIQNTSVYRSASTLFDTNLTVSVLGHADNYCIINIKGVIGSDLINRGIGNKHIDIPYEGAYSCNPSVPELVFGHVVNSYGPEHIEFYGSSFAELGLLNNSQGLLVEFRSTAYGGTMNLYINSSNESGASLLSDYNNKGVFVDLTIKIDLTSLS